MFVYRSSALFHSSRRFPSAESSASPEPLVHLAHERGGGLSACSEPPLPAAPCPTQHRGRTSSFSSSISASSFSSSSAGSQHVGPWPVPVITSGTGRHGSHAASQNRPHSHHLFPNHTTSKEAYSRPLASDYYDNYDSDDLMLPEGDVIYSPSLCEFLNSSVYSCTCTFGSWCLVCLALLTSLLYREREWIECQAIAGLCLHELCLHELVVPCSITSGGGGLSCRAVAMLSGCLPLE